MPEENIWFGDRVEDTVSGFTGIATGFTLWISGCRRWVIQPEVRGKKSEQLPECHSIDEGQLKVLKKGVAKMHESLVPKKTAPPAKKEKQPPGGPYPTPKQF